MHSGRLVTADVVRTASGAHGDAVLMSDGAVVAVGRANDLRERASAVDAYPGGTITAGFRDAHMHPVGHAASLHRPNLKAAPDFAAIADLVRDAARTQPPGSAIAALRLDDESLAEGRLPDRGFLDSVVADRPVLLVRYCGHVSVANTAALEAAGIVPGTPDPPGGTIDRDDFGRPTGVLRETASDLASAAVRSLAPPVTPDQLAAAGAALAAVGLTGVGGIVSTAGGCWAGPGSELDALIAAAPELPIDVGVLVIADAPGDLERAAERIADAGGRLRFLGWKAFSDGSLGGHTAAMREPFADRPDTRGTDRLDPAWAREMALTSVRLGGRVAIHAIGDAANGTVLDVMEGLIREGVDPASLRVEHASVLTREDIARFGRLGVTACVQPAFLASETSWLEKRLGPERMRRTYPFRSLLEAGTPIAGSSDCPVEPPHPLWGVAVARDRAGLVPEEALDAEEALALFTTGAADAIGADAGLASGSPADLVVLDTDPGASPDDLRRARVLATYVDGDRVDTPDAATAWIA
jgi:predicted amidohydrolase YtcJ